MSKTAGTLESQIVWNELHCGDLDALIIFYGELFGWTTRPEERATYTHFYLGEQSVAGVMPLHSGPETPARWQVYVGSLEVDAYAERAVAAGGKLVTPVMDIPEAGKFCAVADPEGAVLSAFNPAKHDRDLWERTNAPGTFCWVELLCRDTDAARAFYSSVVGWEMREMDLGGGVGPYTIIAPAGSPEGSGVGGIQSMPAEDKGPSCWLPYVSVEDVAATSAKAESLGGKLFVPATDIPNVGCFAVLADPEGAMFALYRSE